LGIVPEDGVGDGEGVVVGSGVVLGMLVGEADSDGVGVAVGSGVVLGMLIGEADSDGVGVGSEVVLGDGRVPPPVGASVVGAEEAGVISPFFVFSSFILVSLPVIDGVVADEDESAVLPPPAQREFRGDRSQMIFMI
jgi:hypothetical protein